MGLEHEKQSGLNMKSSEDDRTSPCPFAQNVSLPDSMCPLVPRVHQLYFQQPRVHGWCLPDGAQETALLSFPHSLAPRQLLGGLSRSPGASQACETERPT